MFEVWLYLKSRCCFCLKHPQAEVAFYFLMCFSSPFQSRQWDLFSPLFHPLGRSWFLVHASLLVTESKISSCPLEQSLPAEVGFHFMGMMPMVVNTKLGLLLPLGSSFSAETAFCSMAVMSLSSLYEWRKQSVLLPIAPWFQSEFAFCSMASDSPGVNKRGVHLPVATSFQAQVAWFHYIKIRF